MPRCVAVLLAVVAVAEDASHLLAPSVRRPFVFYHIDKTAGSSLRAIISDAAARARLPAVIPCYGGAAAVVAGHFSPLGLSKRRVSGVDERTCLVFLREPVARHASFYRFYGHQKYFGNRSFGALSADEQRAAIARSGGPAFMAEFLACDGERCPANVTRAATLALRRCYVGTAERFNSSMAFLSLAAPWLGTYAALSRTRTRTGPPAARAEPARAAALAAAMPEDSALYGAAAAMLEAQLEAASRCGEGAGRPRATRPGRARPTTRWPSPSASRARARREPPAARGAAPGRVLRIGAPPRRRARPARDARCDAAARLAAPSPRAARGAPAPAPRKHIPKCGSTFANTVVHALCDGVPPNASEQKYLGKTPNFIKGRSCPRLAVPVRDGWGRHDDLSAGLLAKVGGADRVVALLREPRARAEAAWNHVNVHGVPSPKGPPAGDARQFAEATAGCAARTLAGRGTCLTPGRGDDKARDAAIARLRELAFVGVVERWAESICLFHLQFGAPCLAVEFEHLRSQPHNRTVPRAARNVDDGVYAEARRLFAAALDRHGATPERCAALWAPAIHNVLQ
ncbi:hypothetical protein JL720_16762 [Aureococcus anophagefferens]|nr:hypothetical protein JL720_16762 [Aureococcus anophagefferens]